MCINSGIYKFQQKQIYFSVYIYIYICVCVCVCVCVSVIGKGVIMGLYEYEDGGVLDVNSIFGIKNTNFIIGLNKMTKLVNDGL